MGEFYLYAIFLVILNGYVCWYLWNLEKYLRDHDGEHPRVIWKWPWEKP